MTGCTRCWHTLAEHTPTGCGAWVRIVPGLPDTAPCRCLGWLP